MTNTTLNSFDMIAPCYDTLARVVYGKSIIASQEAFLHLVPPNAHVLILGGGTGWIIERLLLAQPNCSIWYVETSQKMIAYARKKASGRHVNFIHGTIEQLGEGLIFDVVLTNFFLDLFTDSETEEMTIQIKTKMKPEGLWLVTDFIDQKAGWQKMLLFLMYGFFRITGAIKNKTLPYWEKTIASCRLTEVDSKSYYKGFIKSIVYTYRV